MDRCGSGGLPIHHLDRPDIYFPDVKTDGFSLTCYRFFIAINIFWFLTAKLQLACFDV